ncbi:endolytic transglycosylase MltG [Erythrobacter sp. W53]|uniref:endolytic transglycosylase MltG n=1 Tax=Erythrobacter sp. W53 TaxID=3425947 RepID=UPI003D768122
MRKGGLMVAALLILGALAGFGWLILPWTSPSNLAEDTQYTVPSGATLTSIAHDLEDKGHIDDADAFLLRAKIFGGSDGIKAGEFLLPGGASPSAIVATLQDGQTVRRFVTIPEGMPSIMVLERLEAVELLSGEISAPPEGSIMPDTYDYARGESREAVLNRMRAAMDSYLDEAWEKRSDRAAVSSIEEAVILASIIEKETADKSELRKVSGVLSNRIRIGMRLGADATTIYPITKGKPLGRMIRVSELRDPNPYNTRAIAGLPVGPITNPSRAAIAAALDPEETEALYYVADGSGGHVFAKTLEEHNRNVAKWREFRAQNGI